MKDKKQMIAIYILGIIGIILICFGAYYAIKHRNDGDTIGQGKIDIKFTNDPTSIDAVKQPNPNVKVTLTTSPDTKGYLTEINLSTFKKLFETSNKSLLVLEKDDCEYCKDFEPKYIEALKENSAYSYKINISKLSAKEVSELYQYIDFTGTPTTYVIENGYATHTYTGTTDKETISAFIEYFYVRNN